MKLASILCVALLSFAALPANAAAPAALSIDVTADAANPLSPMMGDRLIFHSVIRNTGKTAIKGLTAWIGLVRMDRGNEQPMDLEDWSAHKAITVETLAPGRSIKTDWPMRLIQAGSYRVLVSAASRGATRLTASPFVSFGVRRKPVVESRRVMPVALGVPLILIGMFLWRRRRTRAIA